LPDEKDKKDEKNPPNAGKVQDPCSCVYVRATGETKKILTTTAATAELVYIQ
jgi:hypothetical protein